MSGDKATSLQNKDDLGKSHTRHRNKLISNHSNMASDEPSVLPASVDDAGCSEDENYEHEYEDESGVMDYLPLKHQTDYCSEEVLFNIDPVSCPICFTKADSGTALKLPGCGHSFCIECFQHYIRAQIDEGRADCVLCPLPATQCGSLVKKSVLNEILDDRDQTDLEKFSVSAFVLRNADYHYCPTANCSNVVYWKLGNGPPIVDCFKCKKISCLKCSASPYHEGLTCEQYKVVREEEQARRIHRMQDMRMPPSRCVDRSRVDEETKYSFETTDETISKLHIRCCRRCGNGVELGSGCYKMKCRCGYRFCFQCGSENALCSCTPMHHGFSDNVTGRGDFTGLDAPKSYT